MRRLPEADRRDGGRLRDRRRPRAAPRAATSRSPPTTRASARSARGRLVRRRLRREPARAASSGPRRPRRSGSCAASTAREAGARHGPGQHRRAARASSRTRPSSGAARCSQLSPFALRLMKASFHADEDGFGGIQQLAHDANLLFYASDEAKEGREAYKAKRKPDFAQFPEAALSPLHIWLMAARPRTLPAAAAPVLVGTALAATLGTFKPLTLRRRAARRAVHPDRDEPLQRLLRRPPRRRHRGPARARARHGRRARPAAPGADRDLRRVRARRARRRLPDRRPPAGSCCSSASRRSSPASSTPAARGRTATRGSARCSCSCSSASSPSPARTSASARS